MSYDVGADDLVFERMQCIALPEFRSGEWAAAWAHGLPHELCGEANTEFIASNEGRNAVKEYKCHE